MNIIYPCNIMFGYNIKQDYPHCVKEHFRKVSAIFIFDAPFTFGPADLTCETTILTLTFIRAFFCSQLLQLPHSVNGIKFENSNNKHNKSLFNLGDRSSARMISRGTKPLLLVAFYCACSVFPGAAAASAEPIS